MYFTDMRLAMELLEAGSKVVDPPSSVDELLPLLDQIEGCLSMVEQSPSEPIQNALPPLKALLYNKFVRHVDLDVKVAVASCISEITRITAPNAPYNDDQMKDIFRLFVSSFENLHDKSSRSYKKRTSILETCSKVRSCLLLLDLECDDLILEMFQHFLKTIREDHPEKVFSSMETIMVLVLEESEDISPELLSPILASVKKNNEDILPIAQELGERVLVSSATKIKPYLVQAVNALGISLDDYSDVLASICHDAPGHLEQNDVCATSDHVVLAEELLEAGNKLVDPPSSVNELLLHLDQIEGCLSMVEQSPSEPMQNALPRLKALLYDKFVRHVDVDVKVAVASCISEITRITAPNAPYNDDQMKDIFRLIVSSFENLHDKSSRSYKKRTSILEIFSKVRSCLVMLDLECDDLILEMFQHFLKTIREDHPEKVFSSMETIMILVLEESEDISLELLSPILASVKKNSEGILPIAQKLGERVLVGSAAKIKPYLVQAVNALGISLDDYSDVLASICQGTSGNWEQRQWRSQHRSFHSSQWVTQLRNLQWSF